MNSTVICGSASFSKNYHEVREKNDKNTEIIKFLLQNLLPFITIDLVFGKQKEKEKKFPWKQNVQIKMMEEKWLYFKTTHDHETMLIRS